MSFFVVVLRYWLFYKPCHWHGQAVVDTVWDLTLYLERLQKVCVRNYMIIWIWGSMPDKSLLVRQISRNNTLWCASGLVKRHFSRDKRLFFKWILQYWYQTKNLCSHFKKLRRCYKSWQMGSMSGRQERSFSDPTESRHSSWNTHRKASHLPR